MCSTRKSLEKEPRAASSWLAEEGLSRSADGHCPAIQYLLYIGVPLTNTAATSSSRNPSQFLRTSPEAHQPGRTGAGSRGTAELQGPNEITHLCKTQQAKESCQKTIVKQKRRSKLIDAVRNCLQNRAGQRQGKRLMRLI